jgi:CRISPR-associated protein Csc2
MSLANISELNKFAHRFVPAIPSTPTGRYASIILLRETKSYAVFTTEGGEQQDVEQTQAGLTHSERTDRLVMFKRKQVAPERRVGKALLRQYGAFPFAILQNKEGALVRIAFGDDVPEAQAEKDAKKDWKISPYNDCYLTDGLCTHCPDCLTYGYAAVEGEGARKARIMTDSCFSVRPYPLIQKRIKFNVISERSQTSGTITEYDYTMPEVFLPSVVTTVDLTLDEFVYILGNVMRTSRYGKESTRQGAIRNHIVGITFSDVELFANLEFTQAFYDAFMNDKEIDLSSGYLSLADFQKHTDSVIQCLTADLAGRLELIQSDTLAQLLADVRGLNQDEKRLAAYLQGLTAQTAAFQV